MNIYTARFGRQVENGDAVAPWDLPSRPRFQSGKQSGTPTNQAGDIVFVSNEDGAKAPPGYSPYPSYDKGGETFIYNGDNYQQQAIDLGYAQLGVQSEIAESQLALSEAQAAIADRQQKMSEEQYRYWKREYRPLEKKITDQAAVGIDPKYYAARAAADVNASFDKSKEVQDRNSARLGIDPSSPKYNQQVQELQIARAAAEAGARTQARGAVNDVNYQRLMGAASLGRNIPSTAASISGQAAQTYGAAAGTQRGAAATYGDAYGTAINTNLAVQGQLNQSSQFNQQMQYNQSALRSQENAAIYGAIGSLTGNAIGTAVGVSSMCWVAREVYGEANPKWQRFRNWLFAKAPEWLFDLYAEYGEQFAAWLKGRTLIKAAIRIWMDSRITSMEREACHG